MKIGVLSDTHGFLDPEVPKLFAGVTHILHGGDIGSASIILELEQVAPVTAVLGNTDFGHNYRDTETTLLGELKILIHHIVNPHALNDHLGARLTRENPDVVVFGHTHKPFCETIGRRLFFNPGYSGKPKYGQGRSVAILHCDEKTIRPEYFSL